MNTEWHASPGQLAGYGEGTVGPVHAASIEAHLLICARCRGELAAVATPAEDTRRARVWAQIADEIDRPRRTAAVPWTWARVTLGSPALLVATLLALAALIAVPLVAGALNPRAGVAALFGIAPLAPVVGAAIAFRPTLDPAGQLAAATPLATMRLVLLRALVVAAAAIPVGLLIAIALPVRTTLLVGWVVPGLALCLVVLAVGTRFEPTRLAIGIAIGWAAVVASFAWRTRHGDLPTRLSDWAVNQPSTQLSFALVALAAGAVLIARRNAVLTWRIT